MVEVRTVCSRSWFALALLLVGCGDANLNKLWGGDDEAADTLFVQAQMAYDQGEFDKAEDLSNKILERNPRNENAAILLGYTNLSKGGIDPYALARKLIDLSASGTLGGGSGTGSTGGTSGGTTGGSTGGTTGGSTSSDDSSSNASSTLLALTSLINLTPDDFDRLGDPYTGDSGLFANAPIIVPTEVSAELRASIATLSHMNLAMNSVCRFVDDSVKVTGETRHSDASCAKYDISTKNRAKAHFLWAFSHLTESLVYQSVLLYSSATSGASNFETASKGLNGKFTGESGFTEFVGKVTDMKTAIDKVFDTANPNSMIATTLRDMQAVTQAFAVLSGLPEGITKRITSAMDKINELGKSIGGDSGNIQALKGQMTEKLTTDVGGKITEALDGKFNDLETQIKNAGGGDVQIDDVSDVTALPDTVVSAENKTKISNNVTNMCGAFDSLSSGVDPTKKTAAKPKACP